MAEPTAVVYNLTDVAAEFSTFEDGLNAGLNAYDAALEVGAEDGTWEPVDIKLARVVFYRISDA
jgi:hypothetical protein